MKIAFVQNKIVCNSDEYNPKQLTCFHKPWAILYGSIKEQYFDLYLLFSVFYENYAFDDFFQWFDFCGNLNENYYRFAKKILEPRFGVRVNKISYKSKDEFILKISESITNEGRILVPADLIELPYYKDYKVNNHIHFFIIRGYDIEKKVFYVLDNMHIDDGLNGMYKKFTITFDNMYLMAKTCFSSFFINELVPYFWELEDFQVSGIGGYSLSKALADHKNELENALTYKKIISYPENCIMFNKKNENVLRHYAKVLNYKEVYYDILFKKFEEMHIDCNKIQLIKNKKMENYIQWEKLRTLVMYNYKKRNGCLCELEEDYRHCLLEDYILFKYIIDAIDVYCVK